MKRKITLLFLILVLEKISAQNFYTLWDDADYIDSVTKVIGETQSDSLRCMNLFKLSDLFRRNKNTDLYKDYLKQANKLSSKIPFLQDIAVYYNASQWLERGDLNGYERQLREAEKKLGKYQNSIAYSLRAFIFKNLAVLQQLKDDEKTAAGILINNAIPLAELSADHETMSNVYVTLGIVFMNNGNREKADQYLNMAVKSAEKAPGNSYQLLETKLQAYIKSAENATQLNKLQDAKKSLDNAFKILKNYPQSNLNGIFYQSKGLLQSGLNDLEAAVGSYDLGIKNCEFHRDKVLANSLKFLKAQVLSQLGKYAKARDLLIKLDAEDRLSTENIKMYCKHIIINSDKMGDVKNAYKYSLKYIRLADSLYESDTKKEIAELEARYSTMEKERKITQLETQRQKVRMVTERNYILFGSLSILLSLFVVFLWKNNINQKRLAAEIEKNYSQNILRLKNQKEMEIMQAMRIGEEKERKRIARDLHDGIGSRLSILKMQIVGITKADGGKPGIEEFEAITRTLDTSISELRQIAYNLIPETLLKLGLEHALNDLCFSLQNTDVYIEFHATEIKKSILESNQIAIFRIVQELINNALKHSGCSEIIVDCSQNHNLFLITVEDNGCGFAAEHSIEEYSGLGLKNLKNRVSLLNGKMEIQSSPGGGTIFNIELNIESTDGKDT